MLSSGHDTATANLISQQLLLLAVGLNMTETVNSHSWTEMGLMPCLSMPNYRLLMGYWGRGSHCLHCVSNG